MPRLIQALAASLALGAAAPAATRAAEAADIPYTLAFRHGERTLILVAAEDTTDPASTTFWEIESAFFGGEPALVVVDGFAGDAKLDPDDLVRAAQQYGRPDGGRMAKAAAAFAAQLAHYRDVRLAGGAPQPDDRALPDLLLEHLETHGRVLAVYGPEQAAALRRALEERLGPPAALRPYR